MKNKIIASLLLSGILLSPQIQAEEEPTAMGISIGTSGVSGYYGYKASPTIVLKGVINYLGYSGSYSETEITYDYDISSLSMGAMADYHPYENGFFLSVGLFYINSEVDLTAKASGGNFSIGNNVYNASMAGSITGKVEPENSIAPYFGIGYDSSLFGNDNVFFTVSAGVAYQGDPIAVIENKNCKLGAAECSMLNKDLKAEEQSLNSDLEGYSWWPSIQIGLSYRF